MQTKQNCLIEEDNMIEHICNCGEPFYCFKEASCNEHPKGCGKCSRSEWIIFNVRRKEKEDK